MWFIDGAIWCLEVVWFILPAVIANTSPVVLKAKPENSNIFIYSFTLICFLALIFGNFGTEQILSSMFIIIFGSVLLYFKKYNLPIDFGLKFIDGNRLLGDSKTIFGFLIGVLGGTTIGILQNRFFPAFLLSLGTMVGDSIGSFIKRRLGIARGKNAPLIDDTIFIIVALLFVYPFYSFPLLYFVVVIPLTPILHKLGNIFAHKMKLKEVPW